MEVQTINPSIESSWKEVLWNEFQKPYFIQLKNFLIEEKRLYTIYPKGNEIFNAFHFTPFENVRAVILGQDPYHGPGQAHGLCFSVPNGIEPPPSLINIFKEIQVDLGIPAPTHGNLEGWARQGVLLLNATLTVRANAAGSHQKMGWETFTDRVIKRVSDLKENVVFFLWGAYAQAKVSLINQQKHFVLMAPHPSPLSAHRGFLGCKHFSKANDFFKSKGLIPIDWTIQ